MVGPRLGLCMIAAAVSLAAFAARAADYPQPPPPPPPIYVQPPPQDCCGGWYLRGFIGVGMNGKPESRHIMHESANAGNGFCLSEQFDQRLTFIGGGVGYEWNNWLRFDGTGRIPRQGARLRLRSAYPPTGLDDVRRLPEILDLSCQRLCRSRHVGLFHAVRRRRRRRRAYQQLGMTSPTSIPTAAIGFGRNPSTLGFCLGALRRRLLQRDAKISRSISTYRYLNLRLDHRHRRLQRSAATPIRSNSTSCTRTTSCSACAGPVATSRRRHHATSTTPPPPQYYPPPPTYTPPPPPLRSKG